MNKKVALIILDGWGHGKKDKSNAVFAANTPFTDSLYDQYAHAELRTDGENVGLPEGQMGNSEVGHMNIGAGRVVYQDLVKINIAIREGEFQQHPTVKQAFEYAEKENKKVHLLGLVSDGGVHSHIDHLVALTSIAKRFASVKTCVHAFTDGRDTDPKSGLGFIEAFEKRNESANTRIVSVCGRYYAMDRDKRWERVALAYNLLVKGEGEKFATASDAISAAYASNVTDEFIKPAVIGEAEVIESGDVVICFNFRTDRCREITEALTQQDFTEFGMKKVPLKYITMTNYDDTYTGVEVVYDKDNLVKTLGEVVSTAGKTQIRIAETEKYPHVTFFFSGGRELEFDGERRAMVASPKVATYDLQPEMSAYGIVESIIKTTDEYPADFICLNFANPDMVGHTGVFEAVVKAVETTDNCLRLVVDNLSSKGYSFVVIADHGNADFAVNDDGSPNTAHTTNPVPIWIIDKDITSCKSGKLADVAPTILNMMGIEKPVEMTGSSLIS
ncbi:MAG: 2,3-bisphosphoglycerate-independent phosphoglycerate mutase [Flavobacteriales bacterium]|jgi:2,3-bisphosphoglycerate-independent phosphoglycerate mutase